LPPKKFTGANDGVAFLIPASDSREVSDDSDKGQFLERALAWRNYVLYIFLCVLLRRERSVDLPRGRARPEPEAPLVVAERAERRPLARKLRA
jgi:hypothetical protein